MAYGYTNDFWLAVDQHRRILLHDRKIAAVRKQFRNEMDGSPPTDAPDEGKVSRTERRKQVLSKIEETVKYVFKTIEKGESPVFTLDNVRCWENVDFDESSGLQISANAKQTNVRFDSPQSSKKFSLMLKMLSIMYKLVQGNSFCTKRDIYYQDTVLFKRQSVVDNIVTNISCMLKIPRWELHVLATSKGCVAGDLRFQDGDGNYFDCSATTGLLIPSHVDGIKNLQTNAKFILIIEKDATFQKLLDDNLCQKLFPCILITGKGFPDINTRMLLKKLWDEFSIPIFALVDADPHGMEIMAVYRFGSLALAYESNHLIVPAIRWLGVFPSDIARFKIPSNVQIPITPSDMSKARDLLKRPYVTSNQIWQHEVNTILHSGVKAEIQCLSTISPRFLSDTYIPGKLQQGGWI